MHPGNQPAKTPIPSAALHSGECVWVLRHTINSARWVPGTIVRCHGSRVYDVKLDQGDFMSNVSADHVRRRFVEDDNWPVSVTRSEDQPTRSSHAVTLLGTLPVAPPPLTIQEMPPPEQHDVPAGIATTPEAAPMATITRAQEVHVQSADSQEDVSPRITTPEDPGARRTTEAEVPQLQSSANPELNASGLISGTIDRGDEPRNAGQSSIDEASDQPNQVDQVNRNNPGPSGGLQSQPEMSSPPAVLSSRISDRRPFYGFPEDQPTEASSLATQMKNQASISNRPQRRSLGRGRGGAPLPSVSPGGSKIASVVTRSGRVSKPAVHFNL